MPKPQASNNEADLISAAFESDANLNGRILQAIETQLSLKSLMVDVAKYILSLKSSTTSTSAQFDVYEDCSKSKKRKLNGASPPNGPSDEGLLSRNAKDEGSRSSEWKIAFQILDISFLVPQRKKLSLEIGVLKSEGIRALNPKTQAIEFSVSWKDIEHVVCLPLPEKATAAYNFCVFPKDSNGITKPSDGAQVHEPIVWTVPDGKTKDADTDKQSLRDRIIEYLEARYVHVIVPIASEFTSEVVQANRKGEKAYHTKAFKGSKDGFFFFLSTGIFWGFKKPLHFFSFDHIDSVSYTSVLQRTFNLNITTRTTPDNTQDFEFSMIDQADFTGIDAYVKRHRLQDASMAEQRRAKKLNINGVKGGQDGEDENGEEGSALEKARREADGQEDSYDEDDEEEDDENFDPGSEGESEGSGTSSEEEDGGGGEEGPEGDEEEDEGNLVVEELGSEAEMDDL
ncbi:MAG: hypothetical protein Q9187_007948 [Circinaria calcarea]